MPRPARWKVIIATDGPWSGEMYQSRSGAQRCQFGSVVELCTAFVATTGWPLLAEQTGGAVSGPTPGRPATAGEGSTQQAATKVIVAADEPWRGAVYATSKGRGRLSFNGFEEFLRAVKDVTGWSIAAR